ncbi:MAG: Holliday junction resolvase RuvX [Candidatus Hydrogenedentes bacterium]|nr:Holliday junction resolvase RuvX [Candidatus Hydrogenedentota bacterium]
MALDVGNRRTGIAVTDPTQTIVSPHLVVEEPSRAKAIAVIVREIEALRPVLIVAGVPLDAKGQDTEQAARVRTFIALLQEQITVPVVFQDESFTTVSAEELLIQFGYSREKRKGVIDKVAAAAILQSWLERQQQQQQQQ